ncbi:uncharacterized protein LOC106096140 [Stomoxys calcitrans]|uniref:Uncharacterized protein n=1 Tax=Stomoxys calcitrans TaxID=35570 RepID=A0A1I8Q5G9_STOCA|nr:uncharacterized protein LOC106096140 [Stomoxys calcitrans]
MSNCNRCALKFSVVTCCLYFFLASCTKYTIEDMSTPRKKGYSYNSPYSKPVQQQYASQSDEFISLEMGGKARKSDGNINQRWTNSNFFGSQQKHWRTPRKNDGDAQKNKNEFSGNISLYIHPSMTEDPWLDLMKRIESIEKSQISMETETENVGEID